MASAPREKYGIASGVTRPLNNVDMVLSFAMTITVISTAVQRQAALSMFLGTYLDVNAAGPMGKTFTTDLDFVFTASILVIFVAAAFSLVRSNGPKRVREKVIDSVPAKKK
jgi:hypothetical protein